MENRSLKGDSLFAREIRKSVANGLYFDQISVNFSSPPDFENNQFWAYTPVYIAHVLYNWLYSHSYTIIVLRADCNHQNAMVIDRWDIPGIQNVHLTGMPNMWRCNLLSSVTCAALDCLHRIDILRILSRTKSRRQSSAFWQYRRHIIAFASQIIHLECYQICTTILAMANHRDYIIANVAHSHRLDYIC